MSKESDSVTIEQRWLSVKQAAAYLTTSRDKINQLIQGGFLQKYKLGPHEKSRVLVSKSDLDAYVESCREPVATT